MAKSWKNAERRIARAFGQERRGPTGRDDSDFDHPLLSPEVKYRKALPVFLQQILEQAKTARSAAGKVPCGFILARQMRLADGLIVMRIADFQELFGKIEERRSEPRPCAKMLGNLIVCGYTRDEHRDGSVTDHEYQEKP